MALLPANSTNARRAAIVIQGFHGLQVYADKFWYKHLQAYCEFVHQNNRQFSHELRNQLTLLLQYKKLSEDAPTALCQLGANDITNSPSLNVLNDIPKIKSLVLEVLEFRAKMNVADSSDKTPEGMAPENDSKWRDTDKEQHFLWRFVTQTQHISAKSAIVTNKRSNCY